MGYNLHEKAILVTLHRSMWGASKQDKEAEKEVADNRNANEDFFRVTKSLIDKNDKNSVYSQIVKKIGEISNFHYKHTYPWSDNNQRILPTHEDTFYPYMNGIEKLINEANELFEKFANEEYTSAVNDAKKQLGTAFKASDYPSAVAIRGKFDVRFLTEPLPEKQDFRVNLNNDEISRLIKNSKSAYEYHVKQMVSGVWNRCYVAIKRLVDNLKSGSNKFHNATVDNIIELANVLPALNMTDDPKLATLAEDLKRDLTTFSAEYLKKDEHVRAFIGKKAEVILDKVKSEMDKFESMSDFMV